MYCIVADEDSIRLFGLSVQWTRQGLRLLRRFRMLCFVRKIGRQYDTYYEKENPHEKRNPTQEKQNPTPSVDGDPLLIAAARLRRAMSDNSQLEPGPNEDNSHDQQTDSPDPAPLRHVLARHGRISFLLLRIALEKLMRVTKSFSTAVDLFLVKDSQFYEYS